MIVKMVLSDALYQLEAKASEETEEKIEKETEKETEKEKTIRLYLKRCLLLAEQMGIIDEI